MSAEPIDTEPRRPRKGPVSPAFLAQLRECADKLDAVLAMRCGQMDSESRRDAVMREQRALIESVKATLRGLS